MARQAPCVLVVEDEGAQREVLHYNLEAEGFDVVMADNGEDALLLVAEEQPDLIVLDWMLPRVSGIEVCRRLQAEGTAPNVRIVLITGTPDPVLSTQAAEAGAVALLGKETPPNTIAAQLLAAAEGRVGWSVE